MSFVVFDGSMQEYFAVVREENVMARADGARREIARATSCEHGKNLLQECPACGAEAERLERSEAEES